MGAGISGALGAMGGTKLMKSTFTLVGGMTDAVLSGDLEKNGLGSTLLSIGISSIASWGLGILGKKLNSNIKANSLKKLNNSFANKKLAAMGIDTKIGSKAAKDGLSKIIRNSNWIGNLVADSVVGSTSGFIASMSYGKIIDVLDCYF